MSIVKDLGFAIGIAGVVLAPVIILGGLALVGTAVVQRSRRRA